jgi:bacteriocin biosynthesis cyclodehydratase domain-containing protein
MTDRGKWLNKLRRDAVYLKSEDGIIFRSQSFDFQLKGSSIYDNFTALLPYLDGSISEEGLLAAVQPAQREKTRSLLDMLVDRQVIRRIDPDDLETLEPAVRDRFDSQIDFIGHFAIDPAQRFARFRNARVTLIGEGEAFVSAGLALLDNGLARLTIASTDQQALIDPAWEAQCRRLAEVGVAARVDRSVMDQVDPQNADLILWIGEPIEGATLATFKQFVLGQECAVLPAFVLDRHSYIGPLTEPGRAGCWTCAMLRWSDHASPDSASAFWRSLALAGTQPQRQSHFTGTSAQMLGNGAAMETFRYFVGVPSMEARYQILDQDLDSLEATRRHFARHPKCPRCFNLSVQDSGIDPVASEQDVLARWAPLLGHPFATFAAFEDGNIEHLPVSISLLPLGANTVAGWSGDSVLHARVNALGEAVRHVVTNDGGYLRELIQPRRTASDEVIAPSRISGWLGVGDESTCQATVVRGDYIGGGDSVWIPAAAIHRVLDPAGGFDPGRGGLGVAMTCERAVFRAVRDLLEHEMLDQLADGLLALERYEGGDDEADPVLNYLTTAIGLMKAQPPKIALARHSTGLVVALLLPTDASPLPDGVWIASGLRPAEAVRRLLTRRVAALQLERQYLPPYSRSDLGVFAPIPIDLPSVEALPPCRDHAEISFDEIQTHLAASGSAIVAVDVTPPDIKEAQSLFVIRTLLVTSR